MAIVLNFGVPSVATTYTLSGPSSGTVNVTSTPFTVSINAPFSGVVDIAVLGGGLNTTEPLYFAGETSQTFTITPTSAGNVTLTPTNDGGMTNPAPLGYSATAAIAASGYLLTGPPTAPISGTSVPFYVTPLGTMNAVVTVTLSGGLTGTITKTFSGSSTPQSFTLAAANSTPITLTPTNNAGLTDPPALTCTGQTVIALNTVASTPYSLGTADRYYLLGTDVTANGTAFTVNADNVTLDLNGHTVTYNNQSPIAITNPGFETGNTTGWDVTGCTSPSVVSSTSTPWGWWWGSYILRLGDFTTTQTVKTNTITLTQSGVVHTAAINCNFHQAGTTTCILSVCDAVTNAVIASSAWPYVPVLNSGYTTTVDFTPSAGNVANGVYLRLVLTITADTGTAYIDYAEISVGYQHGILIPSGTNHTSVYNGSVIQGQGHGANSDAIYGRLSHYTTIDGMVNIQPSGMDSCCVMLDQSSYPVVTNSTFTGAIDRISSRQICLGHLSLSSVYAGGTVVANNTFSGVHQICVNYSNAAVPLSSGTLQVLNNTMIWSSHWTDGYGVRVPVANNIEIAYNTIHPVNGRGLLFDGGGSGSGLVDTGTIHHNDILTSEGPNLEYDRNGMETTALRVRNWSGTNKNLTFSDNTFVATTGPGLNWCAIGVRVSQANYSGRATGANLAFINNTCKAYVTALEPTFVSGDSYTNTLAAYGLSISDVEADTGMVFRGNTCASNTIPFNICDNDESSSDVNADITFADTTFTKSTEGASPGYWTMTGGIDNSNAADIRLVDSVFTGGASFGLHWVGAGTKAWETGYQLTITVRNGSAVPQAGATVTITDAQTNHTSGGPYTTDSNGQVVVPGCVTKYSSDGSGGQNATPVQTTLTPLTVAATAGLLTGSASVTPTGDQALTITVV